MTPRFPAKPPNHQSYLVIDKLPLTIYHLPPRHYYGLLLQHQTQTCAGNSPDPLMNNHPDQWSVDALHPSSPPTDTPSSLCAEYPGNDQEHVRWLHPLATHSRACEMATWAP